MSKWQLFEPVYEGEGKDRRIVELKPEGDPVDFEPPQPNPEERQYIKLPGGVSVEPIPTEEETQQ